MSNVDFNAILQTRADSVESPKVLPSGKYHAVVKGFAPGKSDKKGTPFVEFTYVLTRPLDVQPENIAEATAAFAKGPVEMNNTFWLTEKSLFMLVNHLNDDLGIPKTGVSIAEQLQQVPNKECAVVVEQKISPKSGRPFAEIVATLKL